MPGSRKIRSMSTAPPIKTPTFRPATVSSVKLDGRNACRQRMRVLLMPLLFAIRMKSSCSVAIMSLRRSRV